MLPRMFTRCALWILGGLVLATGCMPSKTEMKKGPDQPLSRLPGDDIPDVPESDDPTIRPATHLAAGRLHESQNRLTRAVEQYRLALACQSDNIEASNRLGIVLGRLGRFKEAEEVFQKAIRIAPQAAYLHNNLAFSYLTQHRWADAEDSLRKALELNPVFPRARVNLALALAQQDQFGEATVQFQTVLPAEDAYYNIGLMYQSKRKQVEAARSFMAALELNPRFLAARKRLDSLPPEVIREAERNAEATASPLPRPASMQELSLQNDRPTATQPAAEEVAEEVAIPQPADAVNAATQPANEEAVPEEEPLVLLDCEQHDAIPAWSDDHADADTFLATSAADDEPDTFGDSMSAGLIWLDEKTGWWVPALSDEECPKD